MDISNELEFYNYLDVSERTRRNYVKAVRSSFLKDLLFENCGTCNLFEIDDLKKLWDIYSIVNLHPNNVKNHRNYSAALMKYIRFLNNGQRYGKRIDFGIVRPKRKIEKS